MWIAVEGCAHGNLNAIYDSIRNLEKEHSIKVALLIICGDFQAVRNKVDLECMAVPQKYKSMGDFHLYYSGKCKAYVPTLFIGGNHEASNHLWELYFGGWVANDIYYLGNSGVVKFGTRVNGSWKGIRIAGISGIYDPHDYHKPYDIKAYQTKRLPYTDQSILRSIYHTRKYEIEKLKCIKEPIDIFISHDWPSSMAKHGLLSELLNNKPFFARDIQAGRLGSAPLDELLHTIKPSLWFTAHLHVKYPALVCHDGDSNNGIFENSRKWNASVICKQYRSDPIWRSCTQLLSLDKCLQNREYLQLVEIQDIEDAPFSFEYDKEWLSILRAAASLFPYTTLNDCRYNISDDIDIHKQWVDSNIVGLSIPIPSNRVIDENRFNINPQTINFCKKLGLPRFPLLFGALDYNPEEIDLNINK